MGRSCHIWAIPPASGRSGGGTDMPNNRQREGQLPIAKSPVIETDRCGGCRLGTGPAARSGGGSAGKELQPHG